MKIKNIFQFILGLAVGLVLINMTEKTSENEPIEVIEIQYIQ